LGLTQLVQLEVRAAEALLLLVLHQLRVVLEIRQVQPHHKVVLAVLVYGPAVVELVEAAAVLVLLVIMLQLLLEVLVALELLHQFQVAA
jgi:hypothetical protein